MMDGREKTMFVIGSARACGGGMSGLISYVVSWLELVINIYIYSNIVIYIYIPVTLLTK